MSMKFFQTKKSGNQKKSRRGLKIALIAILGTSLTMGAGWAGYNLIQSGMTVASNSTPTSKPNVFNTANHPSKTRNFSPFDSPSESKSQKKSSKKASKKTKKTNKHAKKSKQKHNKSIAKKTQHKKTKAQLAKYKKTKSGTKISKNSKKTKKSVAKQSRHAKKKSQKHSHVVSASK